jgi:sugar phosphate isomerase/epimerase
MQLCLNQITAGLTAPASLSELARGLNAMRAGGWTALELWLRHWDGIIATEGLPAARRALDDAGLVASGGCAQPGLFFSTGDTLQGYRDQLRVRLERCQALGANHLVVTPGPADALAGVTAADLERGAENLRWAGEAAREHGVRLGIEFLKAVRFVNNLDTALRLAVLTNHPNVGVLVDTFHLYAGPSKLEDLDQLVNAPERLFFVHLNDVPVGPPRDLWVDPDRILPGEGCLPLADILGKVRRTGYDGYVSLELFNVAFAARWAADPGAAARAAYVSASAALQSAST